jgi:hypothetical protein
MVQAAGQTLFPSDAPDPAPAINKRGTDPGYHSTRGVLCVFARELFFSVISVAKKAKTGQCPVFSGFPPPLSQGHAYIAGMTG